MLMHSGSIFEKSPLTCENCRRCRRHRRQICHRYQWHRRQILPPVSLVLLIHSGYVKVSQVTYDFWKARERVNIVDLPISRRLCPALITALFCWWVIVNISGQSIPLAVLAVSTLRMKCFWSPYICIFASLAISQPDIWTFLTSKVDSCKILCF